MRVNVKLFAVLRERAGVAELALEVPEGATVATATARLAERFPGIGQMLGRAAFAVNREYSPAGTVLKNGDELAAIPPVSGGCW